MKHVVALAICEKRVGAVVKQQIDYIEVASLSSPHCRSSNGLAAFCVDLCAGLKKEFA